MLILMLISEEARPSLRAAGLACPPPRPEPASPTFHKQLIQTKPFLETFFSCIFLLANRTLKSTQVCSGLLPPLTQYWYHVANIKIKNGHVSSHTEWQAHVNDMHHLFFTLIGLRSCRCQGHCHVIVAICSCHLMMTCP